MIEKPIPGYTFRFSVFVSSEHPNEDEISITLTDRQAHELEEALKTRHQLPEHVAMRAYVKSLT